MTQKPTHPLLVVLGGHISKGFELSDEVRLIVITRIASNLG